MLLPAAALLVILLGGCGSSTMRPNPGRHGRDLGAGHRGSVPADLRAAILVARRFARIYAAGAYRRRPPTIRPEEPAVRRSLTAAAARVPAARRVLRPHLIRLHLALAEDGTLAGTAWVGDDRFPTFSVGFTVSRHRGRWIVTSFSAPD